MTEQREATFGETDQGEAITLLIETAKEGCFAAIRVMEDFPERFTDPVLRKEARRVANEAIRDFSDTLARANEQRLAARVKQ